MTLSHPITTRLLVDFKLKIISHKTLELISETSHAFWRVQVLRVTLHKILVIIREICVT